MAYEHLLKTLVSGLENTASDFETLAQLLNLRAQVYRARKQFVATKYREPEAPKYPAKQASAAKAASLAAQIADVYARIAVYFDTEPSSPEALDAERYDEDGLLHLVASWQGLRSGVLKAILYTYGAKAEERPVALHPGPASEERLWAEIAAWLEKIVADAGSFLSAQKLPSEGKNRALPKRSASLLDSLVLIEQSFHRATLDALKIAGILPYHLYHTAHRERGGARRNTSA